MIWRSRGYLPHFDGEWVPQFVTFHLGDSVPMAVLERWRKEMLLAGTERAKAERYRRIEGYLDSMHGSCRLRNPAVAEMVQEALLYHDEERYHLHAWCVMPNHVHTLFTPIPPDGLKEIVHAMKSFTSHEANKILQRHGHFWFREYYDRFMRNIAHYDTTVAYIENNPVKARLCKRPEDWPWSSAYQLGAPPSRRQESADDLLP